MKESIAIGMETIEAAAAFIVLLIDSVIRGLLLVFLIRVLF